MSSIHVLPLEPTFGPENKNLEEAAERLSLAIESLPDLSALEMLAAKLLGFIILAGDFNSLKSFMQGYKYNTAPLQRIASCLAIAMTTQDIIIDYAPVVDWFKAENGKSLEVAAISIYLVSVHRLISVSTHEKYEGFVQEVSSQGNYRHMVASSDDAALLMKQIGHIASLPVSVGPPLLSVA